MENFYKVYWKEVDFMAQIISIVFGLIIRAIGECMEDIARRR